MENKRCKYCQCYIMANATVCPHCKGVQEIVEPVVQKKLVQKKATRKKDVFILLCVAALVCLLVLGFLIPKIEEVAADGQRSIETSNRFSGSCGISASAQMGTTVLGLPELNISIQNLSGKDISAIKFYAVPYDVYGEKLNGWTSQNDLYTDTTIPAWDGTRISYQFIDGSVKMVDLYLYSVYFADGTEWGDKDAVKSTILKHGAVVPVSGE